MSNEQSIREEIADEDQILRENAHVATDADLEETATWTQAARLYADRIEQNSEGNET